MSRSGHHSNVNESLPCKGGTCPKKNKCKRFITDVPPHNKKLLNPQYSQYLKTCCNFIKDTDMTPLCKLEKFDEMMDLVKKYSNNPPKVKFHPREEWESTTT